MRCAIYTRKSSAEGLDSQYTSLEAQREYCSAYISSQRAEGWEELPQHYDDGGFSGGTLTRPALRQLRDDIAANLVNMVVVYKIDRLSRSLRDFVNLIAEFEIHNVGFVSVTQAFNTSSSMGRLTLNVLLSFAQFERELTSERLKDWFAGARARGLWANQRPYGYQVVDDRLVIDTAEAKIVRHIYTQYPRIRSARLIANTLNAKGLLNKHGRPWSKRVVTDILQNRLYCGYHPNKAAPAEKTHAAIISDAQWRRTQEMIAESGRHRQALTKPPRDVMLRGIIYSASGHTMIHVPVRGRNGQIYRYYVSTQIHRYGAGSSPAGRFRAVDIEDAVVALICRLTGQDDLLATIKARIACETDRASAERCAAEIRGLIRRLVQRVEIGAETMTVTLISGASIRLPTTGCVLGFKKKAPPIFSGH